MKTKTKALFAMAVLALAAMTIVVSADSSDAAETLDIIKIDNEPGVIAVYVDKDVSEKIFTVFIDGVQQNTIAYGQTLENGNAIIISIEAGEDPQNYVLKNSSYADLSFTYPETTPAPVKVTVTFMNGTEQFGEPVQVDKGTSVAEPTDKPTRSGADFKYWSPTEDGAAYDFSTPVNADTVLYAVFEPFVQQQFTVTFVTDEGTSEVLVDAGETITSVPDIPARDGYNAFWSADGTTAFDFGTRIIEDITLTAVYTPVQVTPVDPVGPEDMKDLEVGGVAVQKDEPTVYDINQRVNVVSDWTLSEGAIVVILGQLVVPEGVTVTVEAGAQLILSNPSEMMNVADIKGTLVIQDSEEKVGAGIVFVEEGTVSVSGALEISGMMMNDGELMIEKDSRAIVEEAGEIYANSEVTVKEGAVFQIDGVAGFSSMMVYGTVIFDSEKDSLGGMVFLMNDSATVDIQMFTSSDGALAVSDEFLVLYSYKDKETKKAVEITVGDLKDGGNINVIDLVVTATGDDVVGQLTDVKITEKVTSKSGTKGAGYIEKAKKVFTNTMDISGNVFVTAEYNGTAADAPENMSAEAYILVFGGMGITVDNGLTVTDNVFLFNGGKLKVSTVIDVSAEKASFTNMVGTYGEDTFNGTITLSDAGEIIVYKNVISDKTGINAAYYKEVVEVDKKKETYYHYVTIDAALTLVNKEGNTVDKIDVIGENILKASNGVPKDVTLNLNEGSMVTIGEKAGADVILTVLEGADLKGTGTVDVKGTLYVEDKRDKVSTVIVQSDVYSEQIDAEGKAVKDGWAKWTNLTTALNEANDEDVIEVYRTGGNVEITTNTTIKSGVTVIVEAGKAPILIKDGVTLTIDGKLQTAEDVFAETKFATTAMDVDESEVMQAKKSSTIIVNGYLVTDLRSVYADSIGTELSKGAPIAGVYYETEDGFAISTLEGAVAVMDEVISDGLTVFGPVTAGDVTFAANDYCEYILVSDVVVKDIDGNEVKPAFKVGTLTLVASYIQADASVSGTVKVGDASVVLEKAVGAVVTDDEKLVLTGNISKGEVEVATGKVTATERLFTSGDVVVTVNASAELVAEGAKVIKVDVYGTVSVASAKMFTATNLNVYENGVLSVAPATSTTSPGVANIAFLQVGGNLGDYVDIGAGAVVNGPVKVSGVAVVFNGAALDDAAKVSIKDLKNTEYYVEGALWITVYDASESLTVGVIDGAPVENAKFLKSWTNESGDIIDGEKVGAKTAKKVHALINPYIYEIKVLANEGIDDVFIDGLLMDHDSSNAFYKTVMAGNHEITYKLANGYSGTAKLYVNGAAQTGMTFTTSGTPGDESDTIGYTLQISGIEKSGFVDPVQPVVPTEGDDEMGLTEYLLIVLVVLAAILVVVVTIRMMRS